MPRVDVLKIDVEGAERDVLLGIADEWSKIRSVAVEVHDVDGRLKAVQELLEQQGFVHIRVSQENVFRGTSIFSIWAARGAQDR